VLLGRASYEAFSKVWPDLTEFYDGKDSVHPGYRAVPKYVVSTALTDEDLVDDWGETTILRSLDEVAALKETEGGPIIIHGSATLARNLSDAGPIDRHHLLVFPVLLGAGKSTFSDRQGQAEGLKLVESETYANGRSPSQCPTSDRSVKTARRSRIETMFRNRPRPCESRTLRGCLTERSERRCRAALAPSSRRPAR
jgi:dihydrofolate reductase